MLALILRFLSKRVFEMVILMYDFVTFDTELLLVYLCIVAVCMVCLIDVFHALSFLDLMWCHIQVAICTHELLRDKLSYNTPASVAKIKMCLFRNTTSWSISF